MINFQCDKCLKLISVADQYAGKRGKCRSCGAEMAVPKPGDAASARGAGTLGGSFSKRPDADGK